LSTQQADHDENKSPDGLFPNRKLPWLRSMVMK